MKARCLVGAFDWPRTTLKVCLLNLVTHIPKLFIYTTAKLLYRNVKKAEAFPSHLYLILNLNCFMSDDNVFEMLKYSMNLSDSVQST